MEPPDRARRWAALVLAIYTMIVGAVFIVPRPIDVGFTPWLRGQLVLLQPIGVLGWLDYEFVEYAAHVVLFVPFGILAVVAVGRGLAWLAMIAGLGLGWLIEYGPSLAGAHTPPSGLDLALNVIGVVAGVATGYAVLAGLSRRSPRPSSPRCR